MATADVTNTRPPSDDIGRKLAFFRAAQVRMPTESVASGDDRITPEPVSNGRAKMVSAGIRYLSDVLKQLIDLRNEVGEDEFGVLRATKDAYEMAFHLVTDAAILAACDDGRQIPRGRASTDSDGGIRIDWLRQNAAVCLIVPASGHEPYIFHEVAGNCATEFATDATLSRWLREIL